MLCRFAVAVVVVCALAAVAGAEKVRYDGFKIVEVTLTSEAEKATIDVLTAFPMSQVSWNSDHESCNKKGVCNLMVGPMSAEMFDTSSTKAAFSNVRVVVEDLQAQFEENAAAELAHPYVDYKTSQNEFFEAYREYDEIVDYFNGLVAEFPTLVRKVASIGESFQGEPIWALVIHNQARPVMGAVAWNGLQHCREWIAGHSLMFTADAFLRRYGSDPNITSVVDSMEVHIIPVFNPDGYKFTRSNDNNWRKNRQPNANSPCIGTDLNRNWVHEWATVGSSPNPCSDTFHGPSPLSAPETTAVDNYVRQQPQIGGYMDWHSSGNLWMTPWGCYAYDPEDIAELMATGTRAANAVRTYRGTVFDVGPIYDIIYPAAGSSVDTTYAEQEMGRLHSYALEIGTSFQPNPTQIVPTGEEMLRGALVHCQDTLVSMYKNGKIAQQQ